MVISHGGWILLVLYKADHGMIALRIKFVIIISLQSSLIDRFSSGSQGIARDIFLDGILVIGYKSEACIEIDFEGLVIECKPGAWDWCSVTLALFTDHGVDGLVIFERHLKHGVRCKAELVILIKHLKLVRHLMRTHLLLLEQIHVLGI